MWAAALIGLVAGGPFGVCLLLAAGVTASIKAWKVDSQFAARGELPPSARLVDKWLDRRDKAGKPVKPAKFGAWRYGWLRWQAMWEDLTERFQEVRADYKKAAAEAKSAGRPAPPKPSVRDTLTGWKWQIDEPAVDAPEPGRASGNPGRPPASTNRPGPAESKQNPPGRRGCSRCGDVLVPSLTSSAGGFCVRCDTIRQDRYDHTRCERCGLAGRAFEVRPVGTFEFIHAANRSTACPRETPQFRQFRTREPQAARNYDDAVRNPTARSVRDRPQPTPRAADPDRSILVHCSVCGTPWVASGLDERTRWDLSRFVCDDCRAKTRTESDPEPTEQENLMAQPGTHRSGEVTGIPSAVNYLRQMADVHTMYADNEDLATALERMGAPADSGKVRAAMTASSDAASLYQAAAKALEDSNAGVRDAYAANADAADKQYQTAR